jgi:hypothetical protein
MLSGKDAACVLWLMASGCASVLHPSGARDPSAARPTAIHMAAASRLGPELRIATPPAAHAEPQSTAGIALAASPTAAVAESAENDPMVKLRTLYRLANEEYTRLDSYTVRLRRREQIKGKDQPEETLLCKFRERPFSVYFKWVGKEGKGREVIYVAGRHENKIHTLLASGDAFLMPAGSHIALPPDNPLVLASSRHAITEAGIGFSLAYFGEILYAMQSGDQRLGSLTYLGLLQRPEFAQPCEAVEQMIPPGREPCLPHGGRRLWLFDPQRHLPTMTLTRDDSGHEVEYYYFDQWQYPVHLTDDDFDPGKLWH